MIAPGEECPEANSARQEQWRLLFKQAKLMCIDLLENATEPLVITFIQEVECLWMCHLLEKQL